MATATIKFTETGIKTLSINKPILFKIQTETETTNYVGVAQRGRAQERLLEILAEGKVKGVTVFIEQMASIDEAEEKKANIIKRSAPKYNTQGKGKK